MAISLALIIILGLGADYLFRRLKLPGLVGMLLVGILVGPHVLGLLKPEMMAVSADFRKIALIVILLRAGFTLRRETLNRTARPALLMSFVPASFEIAGVSLAAVYLFHFSWLQAAMLGAIIGAVSPAVVVPMMIYFMEQGKGAKKGIPTFVLAGSALDNVFAIVIFTQFLSLYQGVKSSLLWDLASIPVAVILGTLLGLVAGYLLYLFFSRYELASPRRTIMVLGVAIVLTWIGDLAKDLVPIASLLGVLAMGLVILEKAESLGHLISQKLQRLWVFAELLLFVLVGAQVNPKVAWGAGAAGLAIIGFGLIFRSLGTYLSVLGAGLDLAGKALLHHVLYPQGHRPGGHRRHSPGGRGARRRTHPGHGGALGPDHRPARGHRHLPVGRKSPGKGRTQRLSLFHPEGQVETAPGGPAGPPQALRRRVEGHRGDGNLGPGARRGRRYRGAGPGPGPPVLEGR